MEQPPHRSGLTAAGEPLLAAEAGVAAGHSSAFPPAVRTTIHSRGTLCITITIIAMMSSALMSIPSLTSLRSQTPCASPPSIKACRLGEG